MSRRSKGILWSFVFILIFALSLDYWRWGGTVELLFGGLPGWLAYFVVLQLLFAGAVLVFIRNYWQGRK